MAAAVVARGLLAFTSGAKPGRTVNAAATKAAMAHIANALTMTFPFANLSGPLERKTPDEPKRSIRKV